VGGGDISASEAIIYLLPVGAEAAGGVRTKEVCAVMVGGGLDFERLWQEATTYERFATEVEDLRGLWEGVYQKASIPEWAIDKARARGQGARFLVINEDWCWDGANTVPYVAKLADEAGDVEVRIIGRDEHPEVMDRYLTGGARSIPIVIALDSEFRELGHWGPRPRELQAWATEKKGSLPKREFYGEMRRWHVNDGGESVIREVLELL
jgi:hypothetical protein